MKFALRLVVAVLMVAAVAGCDESPVGPAGPNPGRFSAVATGQAHVCALDTLSRAWCWGANHLGQLGVAIRSCGTSANPAACNELPNLVGGNRKFTAISAGASHTCAIDLTGDAYCWGSNSTQQLGSSGGSDPACGTTPCSATPVLVSGGLKFKRISAGSAGTCAITTNDVGKCWGSNTGGLLGTGSASPASSATPVTLAVASTGDSTWSSIGAPSTYANCGTTLAGKLACWGTDLTGMLAQGGSAQQSTPMPVTFAATTTTMHGVAVGIDFACALDATNAAWCWGQSTNGSLGVSPTGSVSCAVSAPGVECFTTPKLVVSSFHYSMVSAGTQHACGISTEFKETRCWGQGKAVGAGPNVSASQSLFTVPYPVVGGYEFSAVGASQYFSCALNFDRNIYCWGDNLYGQLGVLRTGEANDATPAATSYPIRVITPDK